MNSYFNPGHKTSRNWSKPRQWCAFLSAICWFSSECLTTISLLPWIQISNYKTIQQTRPNLYNIVILLRWGKWWNNLCQHVGAVKSCWEDFQIQSQRFIPVSRSERLVHFDIFLNLYVYNSLELGATHPVKIESGWNFWFSDSREWIHTMV